MPPRTAGIWASSVKTGSSSPQITGSHSLGMISSGPIAIAVRKPSRSDSIMLSGGDWSEERNMSSASAIVAVVGFVAAAVGTVVDTPVGIAVAAVGAAAFIIAGSIYEGMPINMVQPG